MRNFARKFEQTGANSRNQAQIQQVLICVFSVWHLNRAYFLRNPEASVFLRSERFLATSTYKCSIEDVGILYLVCFFHIYSSKVVWVKILFHRVFTLM